MANRVTGMRANASVKTAAAALAVVAAFLAGWPAFADTSNPSLRRSGEAQPQTNLFKVADENGKALNLFSLEAYRAEFRYLRRECHRFDLAGPAVQTDGWKRNVPDAEWPFLGFCYFGYSCANLAAQDPAFRDEALAEMRWLIDALQTPRMTGFVVAHFGEPFATSQITPSVFVHGQFLNVTTRYREVSGDKRYDQLIHRVARAFLDAFSATDQGILKSYRDMWWTTDNFPALSGLARYARIFNRPTNAATGKFVQSLKTYYLDSRTGMYCTYIDPPNHRQLQGPRGISQMYGLHFLKDFAPEFAADQYDLAKRLLFRPVLGLVAVREFPEGMQGIPDVDSGPVLFGLGPSASGFAIAAAAINGDDENAWKLAKASAMVGGPEFKNGELRYSMMPPVGQAVILFGKTLLLKPDSPRTAH